MKHSKFYIFSRRCQLFLFCLFALTSLEVSASQYHKNFVCHYKHIAEYINSLITGDRARTLYYLDNLEKQNITSEEKYKLTQTFMTYHLLPITENKFYTYLRLVRSENNLLKKATSQYLANNPNGPSQCYASPRTQYSIEDPRCRSAIQKRIRAIPIPLAVAQAALETGWKKSRFALDGNNFFGIQYTFRSFVKKNTHPYCIPSNINSRVCVFKFPSVTENYFFYSQNLNTLMAYVDMRKQRYISTQNKDSPCKMSLKMIDHMKNYAEDPNYIKILKDVTKTVCSHLSNC